uniref:Endonuclease/exonuclease/phosphatase domain-containing protein n=1 Tax=Manihot esculenta TaxID=3983 RepID=A0A2C9UH52_MANES
MVHATRLDRGLCNAAWHFLFPQSSIKHLERVTSDHYPLLLTLSDSRKATNSGKFHFQAAWLKHPGFLSCVFEAWPSHGSIGKCLWSLGGSLSSWKR